MEVKESEFPSFISSSFVTKVLELVELLSVPILSSEALLLNEVTLQVLGLVLFESFWQEFRFL
jgi:hypothetical protein